MPLSKRQEEILREIFNCPHDDDRDNPPCASCDVLIREFVDLIDRKE